MPSARAATPTPLPWDNTLSMGVSHSGLWFNHTTQEERVAEIEDALAAYQPGETMVDTAADFGAHQINDPVPPAGWTFYEPANPDNPMQLHVIVRDTRNRLGSVVVTNAETGARIGTIKANQQGSEIKGAVKVATAVAQVNLNVMDAGGTTLVQAAAIDPTTDTAVAAIASLTWIPTMVFSTPVRMRPCSCKQHPDDPLRQPHRGTATRRRLAQRCIRLLWPRAFENDLPTVGPFTPVYPVVNKHLCRDMPGVAAILPLAARHAVHAKIDEARAPFRDGTGVLADYQAPPSVKVPRTGQ